MHHYDEYLRRALRETGIPAEELSTDARQAIVAKLLQRFDVNMDHTFPWDTSSADTGSRIRGDGWEKVAEFVGANPCVLFTKYGETLFRFRNGTDVRTVIGEWCGGDFYACDEEVTYLLCHNDHDYLVGWGAAISWVDALPSQSYSHCVICGYCTSLSPGYTDGGRLDGTRCTCCGVRHGEEDSTLADALRYRESWLAKGAPWHEPAAMPKGWDLQEQLQATRIPESVLADRCR